MANQWLRLYSEFAHDPKIQRMSEALQRRFIMLLCIRCSNDGVTLHDDDVTFQLRISNEEWAETKSVFISKNLIDESNNPVAWDRRQFASDSSAPRVAKYRAKQKEACNVTVTPQIQNRTDTDTEQKEQKTSRAPRFDAQAHLVSIGIDPVIASDWITHRKAKKAAITLTVIDGISREAIKAAMPLSDVLAACCQRGWIGFKAEWISEQQKPSVFQNSRDVRDSAFLTAIGMGGKKREEKLITGEVV